jgi:hypothetical protein
MNLHIAKLLPKPKSPEKLKSFELLGVLAARPHEKHYRKATMVFDVSKNIILIKGDNEEDIIWERSEIESLFYGRSYYSTGTRGIFFGNILFCIKGERPVLSGSWFYSGLISLHPKLGSKKLAGDIFLIKRTKQNRANRKKIKLFASQSNIPFQHYDPFFGSFPPRV